MNNINSRVGEIENNRFGTEMKIVKYDGYNDVTVEFQDEHHYRLHTTYTNFKRRQALNPYDRSVFGVGYLGEGNHSTGTSKKRTQEHRVWRGMLERCYSEKYKEDNKSYYGIATVCDEWKCFQKFAEWYNNNKYEVDGRLHLDKDILYPENKIYSPQTCLLVPQRINMLFMTRPNKSGLPNGVRKESKGTFSAVYNGKNLGKFDSIKDAETAHYKAKLEAIKQVAEEYKEIIPQKVYDALINWS